MKKENDAAKAAAKALAQNLRGASALVRVFNGTLNQCAVNSVRDYESACPGIWSSIGFPFGDTKKRSALIEGIKNAAKENARVEAKEKNKEFEGVAFDSIPFGVVWLTEEQRKAAYLYSGDEIKRQPVPVVIHYTQEELLAKCEDLSKVVANLFAAASIPGASEDLMQKHATALRELEKMQEVAKSPDGYNIQPSKSAVVPQYKTEEKILSYWDGTYVLDAEGKAVTEEKEVDGTKVLVPKKHMKTAKTFVRVQKCSAVEVRYMFNKLTWSSADFSKGLQSFLVAKELVTKFNNYFAVNAVKIGMK